MSEITLKAVAPYPATEDDATAEVMARAYAIYARLNHRLWLNATGRDEADEARLAFVTYYSLTCLLRELIGRAGTRQADEVARRLWSDLETPEALCLTLHEWLIEYEITPQAIDEIAQAESEARR
ncbi:hypothetical protein [Spongiactinospora sp. TRM90649]|uniref:hypothetical protein n=1 Tax=Spongiactinospora sp. TRM90649 TaxID=3031114 RepID=UPI0023FA0F2D|nr:hypothetical protein [Spongiactinospora sp. TRM90649]MDF5758567.1 hypothetical protein [Spongiactinospora sp. TRM90649]